MRRSGRTWRLSGFLKRGKDSENFGFDEIRTSLHGIKSHKAGLLHSGISVGALRALWDLYFITVRFREFGQEWLSEAKLKARSEASRQNIFFLARQNIFFLARSFASLF